MGLVNKRSKKKAVTPGQEQGGHPVHMSRTQKKKAALSLQALGERLVKLPDEQLDRIGLPADLLTAVKAAKTIKKHCPLNRQMQYIGSLMRLHDPAPVQNFLDVLDQKRSPGKRGV